MDVNKGLQPGAILHGAYRIERILGQGGFGITYLAYETRLERYVAIKEFFPKDYCDREATTSRVTLGTDNTRDFVENLKVKFLREARYIVKLDHPGIIKIHTAFEENQTAYYVMDFIEGSNLSQLVKKRLSDHKRPLSEKEALRYIGMVGEALEYLHRHSMNHFDVKPANILIRKSDDRPILIDFGLSKQYDSTAQNATSTVMGMSQGYAPMEQYIAGGVKEFSPQTDLYALAATLYYLLAGTPPPDAPSLTDQELTFPAQVPLRLVEPISKAMSPRRADRHASVVEFLKDLEGQPHQMPADDPATEITANPTDKSATEIATRPTYEAATEIAARPTAATLTETTAPPADEKNGGATASRRYSWLWFLAAVGLGAAVWLFVESRIHTDPSPAETMESETTHPATVEDLDLQSPLETPKTTNGGEPTTSTSTTPSPSSNTQPAEANARTAPLPSTADPQTPHPSTEEMAALGAEAYRRNAYSEALQWCGVAARQGSADAQMMLGDIYLYGKGTDEDHAEAARWYRKAAEQGQTKAQFILGTLLYFGDGVKQDYQEAYSWALKAGGKGDPGAQLLLGEMYSNGHGVKEDIEEAAKWYRKSADQGNAAARAALSQLPTQ